MRVARYFCSVIVLMTACTTTTSTSVVSPGATAPPPSTSSPPSSTPSPTTPPAPDGLAVDVPHASNLVAGFGSLWARSGGSLWEISPRGRVVDRIANVFSAKPAAVGPQNLAIGLGSVWTVEPRSVLRVDPSTGHVAARIDVPRGCDQITAGSDAMFLGCRDSRLVRIDPDTDRASVVMTVGVSPIGIAFGEGSMWWINASEAGDVSKIDPSNGSVVSISAPYAKFVVPTRSHVWFIDANGRVFTLDESGKGSTPATKKARVALGVTSSKRTVFINDGDVVSFDADTGTVIHRTRAAGRQNWQAIAGIATLGSNIWFVDPKGQRIVAVPR